MDLNRIIPRDQYPTLKWSRRHLSEHFGNDGALPFWVADMDFCAPDVVIESLVKRAEHGIYGYEYKPDSYLNAVLDWYAGRHRWSIERNHVEFCPSVLSAISILINQHSDEGDGIIIQPPVFFEFQMAIRSNKRKRVKNPLRVVDSRYQMDFDYLEEKAADPNTKILILCNPHNPVGRVWTRDELAQAGEICRRHNVLIVSDEIHGDIVYPPHRYTPIASISDELAQCSATCLSPAKTFNVAGMVDAMAVIANDDHRKRFHDFASRYHIRQTNVFALAGIEAAYSHGGEWLDQVLAYLQGNVDFLRSFLHENLPQVKLVEPEGTYLVWLDFSGLGLDDARLGDVLVHGAGVGLNPGKLFGPGGSGFRRLNLGCSRALITEALDRIASAVNR